MALIKSRFVDNAYKFFTLFKQRSAPIKLQTWAMKMTSDELLKLETFHTEAATFFALALRAEPGSETFLQFKKLGDNAFNQAESYYEASLVAEQINQQVCYGQFCSSIEKCT